MPVFKSGGREWLLSLDAPKVKAVRAECEVDLVIGAKFEFDLHAIIDNPMILPDVLWVLCRKQAETHGVTQEQFLETLIGDVAEDAGVALAAAIVDFIPSRTRREAIRQAWASDLAAMGVAMDLTTERLPEVDLAQRKKVREKINEIFDEQLIQLKSATDSPANSASKPAAKPGES